jgi:triosephosphate isomerase
MLQTPIVVVNFKTYPEATGERAVQLARTIESAGMEFSVPVAVCPQHADLYRVASQVGIPVLAQHVDPLEPGRNTGWVTPASVRAAGAVGALINHSEHKVAHEQVRRAVELCRSEGLVSVVCAADVEEGRALAACSPDFIAVEPPELIGTGVPVSKAKPEIVSGSVEAIRKVNDRIRVLCGAGITTGEDVSRAVELGAVGVLVASGVVRAKDQRAAVTELVRVLQKRL